MAAWAAPRRSRPLRPRRKTRSTCVGSSASTSDDEKRWERGKNKLCNKTLYIFAWEEKKSRRGKKNSASQNRKRANLADSTFASRSHLVLSRAWISLRSKSTTGDSHCLSVSLLESGDIQTECRSTSERKKRKPTMGALASAASAAAATAPQQTFPLLLLLPLPLPLPPWQTSGARAPSSARSRA